MRINRYLDIRRLQRYKSKMTLKELEGLLLADYQRIMAIGRGRSIFFHIEFRSIIWYRIASYLVSKHNILHDFFMLL